MRARTVQDGRGRAEDANHGQGARRRRCSPKRRERRMTSRALVLGGGGPVGIAWECGLLAGLAQAGVDLGTADHIMGTSAGSFVGVRLAMGQPASGLADPIFADAASPVRPVARGGRPPPDLSKLLRLMAKAQ